MRIRIFTVFHRTVDQRLLFDADAAADVQRYFSFYGVNAKWPDKRMIRVDGSVARPGDEDVILEPQLSWHDPLIQDRGFLETSCYIHLLRNNIIDEFDYVGVCQYDMRWTAQAMQPLKILAASSSTEPVAWGIPCGPIMDSSGRMHPLTFAQIRNWPFLLESYNRFFKTQWDARMLIGKPLTLFQTYLLPRELFRSLCQWLAVFCTEVYPWACQPPYETHFGTLSGYSERAESVFIAAKLAEGVIQELRPLPVIHDPGISRQLSVDKLHYGQQT